jgi:hypothetical protein
MEVSGGKWFIVVDEDMGGENGSPGGGANDESLAVGMDMDGNEINEDYKQQQEEMYMQ